MSNTSTNGPANSRSLLRRWANSVGQLHLDFGTDPHEQRLTLTFNFLSSLIGLLVTLTAIWALAVGVIKGGHLAVALEGTHPVSQDVFPTNSSFWGASSGIVPFLSVVVYACEAFGTGMLVCIAAASVGAIVGFLFGVPRPISESGAQISASSGAASGGSQGGADNAGKVPTTEQHQTAGWQSSTNLTQISDWLTKIIVGVGLVDFHKVLPILTALTTFVGGQLLGGIAGTRLVLPSLMFAGSIFGFMYSYLFTQLFLAALMAYSANQVTNPMALYGSEKAEMAAIGPSDPRIAPSPRGVLTPETAPADVEPTQPQKEAARRISTVPLDDISDSDSLLAWARAQAVLNDYKSAVSGYGKLLQIQRKPEVLAEASRVYARAGDITTARTLIEEAALNRDQTSPVARARIVFDAGNYALYDPPPGGYTRALTLLDDATMAADTTGGLHVLRACANGQRYSYEGDNLTQDARDRLEAGVFHDLEIAWKMPGNANWIRYLLTPRSGEGQTDDDLKSFWSLPKFQALLSSPAPPA
jgi:hypothetical protein